MAGWPVNIGTPITQAFGGYPASYQPDGHTGMDFGTPLNSPAYAVADGTVLYEGWASGLGWPNPYYIAIDFDGPANGDQSAGIIVVIDNGSFVSIYGHLNASTVNKGDRVTQGQLIGKTGNTGRSSGPHLHFETLPDRWDVNGRWYGRVNPLNYINEIHAPSAPAALAPNQRLVGPKGGKQRAEPNTSSAEVRVIAGSTVENFDGFVRGQLVTIGNTSTDVWYKDKQGYVWAGVFESQSTDGLPDHTPRASTPPVVTLKPNQRKAGPKGGFQRAAPSPQSKLIRTIEGSTIETFDGFVRGESVTIEGLTSDVWFKDSQGYVWAGVFENQATDGLPDVTPVSPSVPPVSPLKPNQRKTGDVGVNQRAEPHRASKIVRSISPNTVEVFTSYVKGESVTVGGFTSDIWFKDSHGYAWSGGFDPSTPEGLPLEASTPPVASTPVVGSTPVASTPVVGSTPVASTPEVWAADLACVDKVIPAHPDNYQVGNFPDRPTHVVTHQYGELGIRQASVTTWFTMGLDARRVSTPSAGPSSAQFSVGNDGTIIQYVQLKNRAYHAGAGGNDFIGIEIDPEQSEACIAAVIKLMRELNAYYGYELTPILHRDVPGAATSCGSYIKVDRYKDVGFPAPSSMIPVSKTEIIEVLKKLTSMIERL